MKTQRTSQATSTRQTVKQEPLDDASFPWSEPANQDDLPSESNHLDGLKRRISAYVAEQQRPVPLYELQRHFGFPEDHQHNPVLVAISEMQRDRQLLTSHPSEDSQYVQTPTTSQNAETSGPPVSFDTTFWPSTPSDSDQTLDCHREPYTLSGFKLFRERLRSQSITADELKVSFNRLAESKAAITEELLSNYNARQLQNLAGNLGCWQARRQSKQANAEYVFRALLQTHSLSNSVRYSPLSGETYESALAKQVNAITDAGLAKHFNDRNVEQAAKQSALADPRTLNDFRLFVREYGEDQLSLEQLATYDRLAAEASRKQRAESKPTTVAKLDVQHELSLKLLKGFHAKRQIPLWIVQLETRVDRPTFNELNRRAKMLGGWYSSFVRAQAGFQFTSEESAKKFCATLSGDVDRTDELDARKSDKQHSAAERLHTLADSLQDRAEQSLQHDRQTNTARRAEMAASSRGQAYAAIATANTLRSISDSLASGDAIFLDGIRCGTHLEALRTVLNRAKTERNRHIERLAADSGTRLPYAEIEELNARRPEPADIRHASYPFLRIYKPHLQQLGTEASKVRGLKRAATKLNKTIARTRGDYVSFDDHDQLRDLNDFFRRAQAGGCRTDWCDHSMQTYKRIKAANIHTLPELRSALHELLPHIAKKQADDPILLAEKDLIGKKLPGFFPTPSPIIAQMLDAADIQPHHHVLEPSCGKGDILDAIRSRHPETRVTAIELNRTFVDILEAKRHQVLFEDFLDHHGTYDRIVMNPPFEQGQDITHVQHAYSLLSTGGILVAVMSEGPFFRSDRQATAFRSWLEELNADTEKLPDGAFSTRDAFRKTGAATRILVVSK